VTRALGALAALSLLAGFGAGLAQGERSQQGNLIVTLGGDLAPLKLPRDRPAPVAVHLESGLQAADGGLLPRVTRIEIGLPDQGVLSTVGLPTCTPRQLRNRTGAEALAACESALVGEGQAEAEVLLPNQGPFRVHATLLAFNARVGDRRAVILHAYAVTPPTVVVMPFRYHQRHGRLGMGLAADLPSALGPWPRFARFELTLSRRYSYRGQRRSYLSASCPIPRRFTAGFFSFAEATFSLEDGSEIETGITRGCRAQ
jgi:hypothetical protein